MRRFKISTGFFASGWMRAYAATARRGYDQGFGTQRPRRIGSAAFTPIRVAVPTRADHPWPQ